MGTVASTIVRYDPYVTQFVVIVESAVPVDLSAVHEVIGYNKRAGVGWWHFQRDLAFVLNPAPLRR